GYQEIAAAAEARAVAAATMVPILAAAGQDPAARQWLRTAEGFVAAAQASPVNVDISAKVARYLWAARCALEPSGAAEDPGLAAEVAWYLWDRGDHAIAVDYTRELLDRMSGPWDLSRYGGQIIDDAESYLRDIQTHQAVRACLVALLAMAAAADGDQGLAAELADTIDADALLGLPSLR